MSAGIYALKPRFVRSLRRVEDALVRRRVSPDALSWAAVLASVAAGAAMAAGGLLGAPLLWFAIPPLVVVRLALNALDGGVARRLSAERPFGRVLNEVSDRLGDAALLGGTAAVAPPALALGAMSAALGCSLTGVLTETVTGTRASGGPMGKADRAAIVAAASTASAATGSTAPFAFALWVVVAGALVTAVLRILQLRRES